MSCSVYERRGGCLSTRGETTGAQAGAVDLLNTLRPSYQTLPYNRYKSDFNHCSDVMMHHSSSRDVMSQSRGVTSAQQQDISDYRPSPSNECDVTSEETGPRMTPIIATAGRRCPQRSHSFLLVSGPAQPGHGPAQPGPGIGQMGPGPAQLGPSSSRLGPGLVRHTGLPCLSDYSDILPVLYRRPSLHL